MSVYVLYRSYELYDRAIELEKDYRMYREEFEVLKEEMKPFIHFIATELIPQWEKGNTANLQKDTVKVLERMSRFSTVLRELVQSIHRGTKQARSDIGLSAFYSVLGATFCVRSIATGNVLVFVGSCGLGVGIIAYTIVSYCTNLNTLTKLEMLGKDASTMRKEITKYRAQLDLAMMRGKF